MTNYKYTPNDITKILDIYSNTIKLKDGYSKFPIGYIYSLSNDLKIKAELRIIAIVRSEGIVLKLFQSVNIISEKLYTYFNNVNVKNQNVYSAYISDIEEAINNEGILIEKREILYSKGVIPLEILN